MRRLLPALLLLLPFGCSSGPESERNLQIVRWYGFEQDVAWIGVMTEHRLTLEGRERSVSQAPHAIVALHPVGPGSDLSVEEEVEGTYRVDLGGERPFRLRGGPGTISIDERTFDLTGGDLLVVDPATGAILQTRPEGDLGDFWRIHDHRALVWEIRHAR